MLANTGEIPIVSGGRPARTVGRKQARLLHPFTAVALFGALLAMSFLIQHRSHANDTVMPDGVVTDFGPRTSHGGSYVADVTSAAVHVGESRSWTIRLERRNHRRVAHARVQARLWMPETGIESPVRPSVTYIGNGEYRLDDVRLTRRGWWNLALVVDGRGGADSLGFNVRTP
jgi:hypothetical protein